MRALSRPARYVLLAAGFLGLAAAAAVAGTAASAHHDSGLSGLCADLAGASLGLVVAMLVRAYDIGVRVPAAARELAAMVRAMEAGEPVFGSFWAALHEVAPAAGSPVTSWQGGRVMITPLSVTWERTMTGRTRDLTGLACSGVRRRSYLARRLPSHYRGEVIGMVRLTGHGADVEVIATAPLLEILRYSLARTPRAHGGEAGRLE